MWPAPENSPATARLPNMQPRSGMQSRAPFRRLNRAKQHWHRGFNHEETKSTKKTRSERLITILRVLGLFVVCPNVCCFDLVATGQRKESFMSRRDALKR